MSTGGQVVGGLIGGIVGFIGSGFNPTGALYGAQIGIMAGGYLDPPKGPTVNGPRLNDLTVQTSTYGAVIPRVYGTCTVNGNVIWLEGNKLKETVTKKKSGGKGGGSKTTTRTYTYSASFAVGLCEGPIVGVRRIWVGPDLIYDAGSSDPDTIAASNASAEGFAIYLGTNTQSPDPRIQADIGVPNCPAWRGLAYIVFYDLALARYANSLMGAPVRVEVFKTGTVSDYPHTYRSMPASRDYWCADWSGSVFCALASLDNICATSPDGITWTEHPLPVTGTTWWGLNYCNDVFIATLASSAYCYTSHDGISWTARALPTSCFSTSAAWNGSRFVIATYYSQFFVSSDGVTWSGITHFGGASDWVDIVWNPIVGLFAAISQIGSNILTSPDGLTWTPHAHGHPAGNWYKIDCKDGRFLVVSSSNLGVLYSDDGVTWSHSNIAGTPDGVNSLTHDLTNFVAFDNTHFHTSPDGINWTSHLINGDYWTAASWNGAVIVAFDYTHTFYQAITIIPRLVAPEVDTLDNIVSAECLASALLAAGDIDVTALTSQVRGYRIGSIGALRAAIEPLQASWPFDVVQHGYKIKFVARGGASVVTIPAADLDARSGGSAPGVQITVGREMDSQLPRRVTVQHLDYDREYDAGTQYAERLNTAAINATVLDLPIVMTSAEAAGKAEVLLYLYWLERHDVTINLPPTYNQLEPGDVVTLTTPEGAVSLRLTGVTNTSDGRVECQAKYANPAIYTPAALGASPAVTGITTVNPVGASVYHLLDVPYMSGAQSGASFLAAMTGAKTGWRGGVLMRSADSGATWDNLQDFEPPGATIGACTNSLGAVDSRMIDAGSVLSVTLTYGDLFSITQLAMLGGENHFAYGADGRWEIIAAQTCTLVTGKSYTLQNLLRGRFGTEWAMGLHAAGDALVLLDPADVVAISVSSGAIGLSSLYRGITVDRDLSTDSNRSFAYQAVNLKPLSPVSLSGNRDASNDWSLTWVRRTRTGGEWRDYVDAELGEASEQYQIDVFADGTYATVKRTISTTGQSAVYSSANQVADFGANQTTLYLKIYQLSATVGRGYPLTSSITR